jgi:tetratricopeptide (TPR) repeat protein
VGLELARGDHLDRALAKTLEGVACADPNALATAHQVLLRGLSGTERMDELLRQAPLADPQRARRLLDEVLRESASPELLASLDALTEDAPKGLRRTLAEALAEAGQGAHDGGRTRGNYLLRAASLARELGELDQVFAWLTEALASCGTLAALDALDALGSAPEILVRVEGALDRAIDEVFDGPLVRELLLRRASLRRGANPEGAVSDLQRLHELLPGDEVVFDQLVELLRQLGDRVRLAALLEEHLGRGQAPASRKKLQELQTALGSIEEAPEPCTRETAAVSEPPSTLAESARTTVPGHRPVNVPPADDDILVVDEFADTVVPEV